jgi:hypothetical protein
MPFRFHNLKIAVAAAALLAVGGVTQAQADESHAKDLLKAMSDYLAAQNSISFKYDSTLEVVTSDKQKLGFASSGTVDVSRPDKIQATRRGGFADVELNFDGKTVTIFGKNLNLYVQAEVAGTLDNLIMVLRDKYGRPLPAADLISSAPYDHLMEGAIDVKDLGSGVIRGQECDHLAVRTDDVDWQIWIAHGDAPYPCRYVVTSTKIDANPQYTVDVYDWKSGAAAPAVDFTFKAPEGATAATLQDLKDIDELPSQFMPKAQ